MNISTIIHIDSRCDRASVEQLVPRAVRQSALPDYITSHLNTPFKWGEHDCVCFAIGWVQIATGIDYLAPHKPWSNKEEAHAIIERLGGLELMFDKHLKRILPGYAKDGDITLVDGTAYLFSGPQIVGPGKDGLVFKNRLEATCAWSY